MEQVVLRAATEKDMERLYVWANDKEVRKNSFQQEEIPLERHQQWFKNQLRNENCDIWICEVSGEPVGQVRMTYEGETAYIAYSIAGEHRGKGYSRAMLACAEEQVRKEKHNIRYFLAEVKLENIASQRVFEHLDYTGAEILRYKKEINRGD